MADSMHDIMTFWLTDWLTGWLDSWLTVIVLTVWKWLDSLPLSCHFATVLKVCNCHDGWQLTVCKWAPDISVKYLLHKKMIDTNFKNTLYYLDTINRLSCYIWLFLVQSELGLMLAITFLALLKPFSCLSVRREHIAFRPKHFCFIQKLIHLFQHKL